LGRRLGFNAFRINLHYLVWKHDRDGLLDRLDRVMGMAAAVGIDTIPVLFDDCGFGGAEPDYGPQPDPVPGVHNSRAVASPGRAMLTTGGASTVSPATWPTSSDAFAPTRGSRSGISTTNPATG
jgi:hypothetical protein